MYPFVRNERPLEDHCAPFVVLIGEERERERRANQMTAVSADRAVQIDTANSTIPFANSRPTPISSEPLNGNVRRMQLLIDLITR